LSGRAVVLDTPTADEHTIALKSYLGYFGIIWFTWFENTLFDVRFSNDSAFERVCKAMQFGIMAGFAVIGPGYQTGFAPGSTEAAASLNAFRTLSFILMTSRLILTFQYGVALAWLRSYKRAIVPMLIHMAVLFTAAMLFLGLTFAFQSSNSEQVLIGWYVIVALEALAILIVSGRVRFLSFRQTVLVERLGLLTLIILGEGIIGMMRSINAVGSDDYYPSDVIGMILSSVVITYSLWMLYFDQVQPERMGTLRQNIWAILHFPFHACILLVVEGMARLQVWRKVVDITGPLQSAVNAISTTQPLQAQLANLNQTMIQLFSRFPSSPKPSLSSYFAEISSPNATSAQIQDGINNIYSNGINWTLTNFDIPTPTDTDNNIYAILNLFEVVFIYYFVFAGLTLMLLAALFLLGKRHKLRGEILSVGVRVFFGLGLSLVAVMAAPALGATTDPNSSLHKFMFSAWLLPTVLLTYLTGEFPMLFPSLRHGVLTLPSHRPRQPPHSLRQEGREMA
jgi:hypothetical protein